MGKELLTKSDKTLVEKELKNFCSTFEKKVNDHLGFYKLKLAETPFDENIKTDLLSRHYMSLEFSIGYVESMEGIYSLDVIVTPKGVLLRDSDRFLPSKVRNTKCQIDPCVYMGKYESGLKYFDFISSDGYAYIVNAYNEFRKELTKQINANYRKKQIHIGGIRLKSEQISYLPEQTIEYYKLLCSSGDIRISEKSSAELASRQSNLDNFTLDMKAPSYHLSTQEQANITKAMLSKIKKVKIEKSKPIIKKEGNKKEHVNPLKNFKNSFKKKAKDDFVNEKKRREINISLFSSNNFISVLLMIIPPLIFLVNIILVLCLRENFEVRLSSDILWFNEAFTYKLCDIINDAISNSDNFFISLLLWISLILSGILETVLSLIHLVLFIVVFVLIAIYSFGFQTMVGAIIMAILLPIVSAILNKFSGQKSFTPIISLVLNIILVSVYLLTSYLVIGL